jgi:HEAT repeat protein
MNSYSKNLGPMVILGAMSLVMAVQLRGKPQTTDAPQFINARVETQTLQGSPHDAIHRWTVASTKPRWLGYAVASVNGGGICCSNFENGVEARCACALEGNNSVIGRNSQETVQKQTVHLENETQMAVMFRAENGKLSRVRMFSTDCPADAGSLEVLWLDAVSAPDSVAFLSALILHDGPSEDADESVGKHALAALALHADPSADRALQSFVTPNRPEHVRKETAFWLGEARGAEGLRMLQKMAHDDPSSEIRAQVTFALSVSKQPGALPEMIRMAHEDESPHVRGQALFWLAQKAGKKAEGAITGAIENDPDTEVKKKAVFALSQMPKDEGVPKLIEVAQTNRNPEVRKQAMFWLGQSQDPRALAFFEQILSR